MIKVYRRTLKTTKAAAHHFAKFLEATYDANHVHVVKTGEKVWTVIWEEGPYEWSVHASYGESIFRGETLGLGLPSSPGLDLRSDHWYTEPKNHYSLSFVPL